MSGVTDASLYLQLGETFDGLERPQHPQDPQGLDGVDVLAFCPSVQMESTVRVDHGSRLRSNTVTFIHWAATKRRPPNSRYTVRSTCVCSVSRGHACGFVMFVSGLLQKHATVEMIKYSELFQYIYSSTHCSGCCLESLQYTLPVPSFQI